jgi:phosphoglycerate dehydrogenase-like enzyme
MPAQPFNVLATDFLLEPDIETAVLGDIAKLTLAGASDQMELTTFMPEADAILVFHAIPQLGAPALELARRCRGIVRAGVGYNNVDIATAGRLGIPVCNVPDYGTEEVADHAILMLLALARKLVDCHNAIRQGGWDVSTIHGAPRLRTKTLGLVGCGRIGSATALRAKSFGLDVVFYDPLVAPGFEKALGIRRAASLEELMKQSHFVSIHCYLDDITHHLINSKALSQMPAGGLLVNTARGPIVDQTALLEALDTGHLAGAALDVVEREPLDIDAIRHHPCILLTPHAAFYSVEGYVELRRKAAEEIRRLLLGEQPRCLVNSSYLIQKR